MIDALIKELALRKDELNGHQIETIYFGGGTPSILSVNEINRILEAIDSHFLVASNAEVTLEANPDDLTDDKILELAESRINRLSIGVQSFFDQDLKLMNRAHNALEAHRSIDMSLSKFKNVSVDLIYGIQNASDEQWLKNIEILLEYQVPHISSYALTVEAKTALATFINKGILEDVDDAQAERQFQLLCKRLENEGFIHYELSNFGKPNFFSKNNSAYWQGKPYLGIGPSAHSFLGSTRSWNINNNSKYIEAIYSGELPIERENLSKIDRYNETIMTGLRTMWGVSLNRIEEEFGKEFKEDLINQSTDFINEHLLYIDDDKLLATQKGKFLTDGIASTLFKVNR